MPRRALSTILCAAIAHRDVCAATSRRAWLLADGWLARSLNLLGTLGAHAAAAAWPATVLGVPTADGIGLLAPASPNAAFAYVLVAHPAGRCEHSPAARAAWARLIAALGGADVPPDDSAMARLRDAAVWQLADALPPPSLFAVLAAAEAAVRPATSDALRRRSVAAQVARALREVVGALAADTDAAPSGWARAVEDALEGRVG